MNLFEYLDNDEHQASCDRLAAELRASKHAAEVERILREGHEVDVTYEFLAFSYPYELLAKLIPLHWTVIDYGCAFAFQSWWFRRHRQYIGVDNDSRLCDRLAIDGSLLLRRRIQDMPREFFEGLEHPVFAICNAVPDQSAQRWVRNHHFHCYVSYPG